MSTPASADLRIAPRAVFDDLDARADRPRFMVRAGDGAWQPVTWRELATEIEVTALALEPWLQTGERAAVLGSNQVAWASAALAIQAIGGVLVPIYPASTPDQIAYVLGHCDAKVLFVAPTLLSRVLGLGAAVAAIRTIVLMDNVSTTDSVATVTSSAREQLPGPAIMTWAELRARGEAVKRAEPGRFVARLDAVELDRPGLMLYTSGTSGPPKGVPLTHLNVAVNGRDWLECNAPLLPDDGVDVLWLPMSHIFGFGEMCIGNTLGWTSYLADPATCLDVLPAVRANVFFSVPSHWEKLAGRAFAARDDEGRRQAITAATGGALRFCLSGGAGLKREVKELFESAGILLIEGYGLTETSPTLTLNRPNDYRFDSVGKPLPSVELKLADDGEILARGPNVFTGYHDDADATANAFTEDGWFKTGDLGRFTEDGFLQIVDRKKDILVTAGGKNVAPANIEMLFRDDPAFVQVVVYGDAKKYLVAGVWLAEDAFAAALANTSDKERRARRDVLVAERIAEINRRLASFETIKRFVVIETPLTVEDGLLTASLKVRRKAVYARFGAMFEALYAPAESLSAAMQQIPGGQA